MVKSRWIRQMPDKRLLLLTSSMKTTQLGETGSRNPWRTVPHQKSEHENFFSGDFFVRPSILNPTDTTPPVLHPSRGVPMDSAAASRAMVVLASEQLWPNIHGIVHWHDHEG